MKARWLLGLAVALLGAAGALAAAPAVVMAKSSVQATDEAFIKDYTEEIGGRLGLTLSPAVTLVEAPASPAANGDTVCQDAGGHELGAPVRCTITIYGGAHHSEEEDRAVVAHEVFHCFQAQMSGTISHFNHEAPWLVEGSAAWVQSDLVPHDPYDEFWKGYLLHPTRPLFSRSYDAIGFYAHLSSSAIQPWSVFRKMFAASSSANAYQEAVNGSLAFLDNEASVFFRNRSLGSEWEQDDQQSAIANANVPPPISVRYKPSALTVARQTIPLAVAPYADGAYTVRLSAQVMIVRVLTGNVRIRSTDTDGVNEVIPNSLAVCRPGVSACRCPQESSLEHFENGNLAITGGPEGASLKVVGLSLEQFCNHVLPARPCTGLLALSEFPKATQVTEGQVGPLATCIYSDSSTPPEGLSPPPPPIVGEVFLVTLPSEQAAREYFTEEFRHCPGPGCGILVRIGDEAYTGKFNETIGETVYPGHRGFARVSNDIITIGYWANDRDATPLLLSRAIEVLCPTCL